MAGADRMTIEEVVRKVLLGEHADVVREGHRRGEAFLRQRRMTVAARPIRLEL